MFIARSLSGSSVCMRCQLRVLKKASAATGSTKAPLTTAATSRFAPTRSSPFAAQRQHGRSFAVSSQRRKETEEFDVGSQTAEQTLEDSNQLEDSKPWYLQVQDEQAPEPLRLESQKLPDIPPDLPQIVNDILDRLSKTVGLDYLSLLDLRALDPPPALGNNLIMILGTARSEKHLNSSADRFCRWLRSVYKMQPTADGLLGRNEMKLKLRRKSRRAKLLGGRPQIGPVDDGITTGWISVDLGPVGDGAETEATLQGSSGDVSGFGVVDDRIRLVVQMMTEEKREELQLEELWTDFLEDQRRKEEKGDTIGLSEAAESARPKKSKSERTARFSGRPRRNSVAADMPFVQRRTLCTSASRLSPVKEAESKTINDPSLKVPSLNPSVRYVTSQLREDSLHQCLRDLEDLPEEEAVLAIGRNWQDRSSTAFLTRFYSHFGAFTNEKDWIARLQLVDKGRHMNHPGYTVDALVALLLEMEESCVQMSSTAYEIVLRALQKDQLVEDLQADTPEVISSRQLETILEIMENMTLRKLQIPYTVALDALANEMWRATLLANDTGVSKLGKKAATEVALAAIEVRAHLDHQPLHIMAMQELAKRDDWTTFWKIWRSFAKREMPRSANMYTAMFNLVASSQSQSRCAEALSEWIPEMEFEEPSVKLEGAVAQAVIACVRVSEPDVDFKVRNDIDGGNQMVRLYKRCRQTIG